MTFHLGEVDAAAAPMAVVLGAESKRTGGGRSARIERFYTHQTVVGGGYNLSCSSNAVLDLLLGRMAPSQFRTAVGSTIDVFTRWVVEGRQVEDIFVRRTARPG